MRDDMLAQFEESERIAARVEAARMGHIDVLARRFAALPPIVRWWWRMVSFVRRLGVRRMEDGNDE